jgi:hypothetical protein
MLVGPNGSGIRRSGYCGNLTSPGVGEEASPMIRTAQVVTVASRERFPSTREEFSERKYLEKSGWLRSLQTLDIGVKKL